jgi:D-alanyl-lipoteichoic acid acyltransferase DltB (MBOAT superfamily)
MGFKLMVNFDRPYRALTIAEFWRRWHISLSSWFRDYLYIPLGGNKQGPVRQRVNQFIVFLVSGLWHGASWNFVIWGAIHGFYLIFADLTKKVRYNMVTALGLPKMGLGYTYLQRATVFVLVSVAWVFFRADTLPKSWYIVTHFFKGDVLGDLAKVLMGQNWQDVLHISFLPNEVVVSTLAIATMVYIHELQVRKPIIERIAGWPAPMRYTTYVCTVLMLYHYGKFTSATFIYFQF